MDEQDKRNGVDTPHPLYKSLQTLRDTFHAVKGGTRAIRAGGSLYLPRYPDEQNYDARLRVSTISGLVAGGIDSLTGAVFAGDIDTSQVAPQLVPYLENIDLKGTHFNNFARDTFEARFDGAAVIFVDMPQRNELIAETERLYGAEARRITGVRPYWTLYRQSEVINWRYREDPVTKSLRLALLVVRITVNEPVNDFVSKPVTIYRAWHLEPGGSVRWEEWRPANDKPTMTVTASPIRPKMIKTAEGRIEGIGDIPAVIIGDLEAPPELMIETDLEVKAYQKESSFDVIEYLQVPSMVIIGRDPSQRGEPISLGADTIIDVPAGGDVKFAQIDASGLGSLRQSISEIKQEIRERLSFDLSAASGTLTATEAAIRDRDKQARLFRWADDLKDGLERALQFTGRFEGLPGGAEGDAAGEISLRTRWVIAAEQAALDNTILMESEA